MGFPPAREGQTAHVANVLALIGSASVALAISSAVWLVLSFVGSDWIFSLIASAVTALFVYLWFAWPVFERVTSDPERYG